MGLNSHEIENIYTRKEPTEILALKVIIPEMKSSLEIFNSRFELAEELVNTNKGELKICSLLNREKRE